MSRTDGTFILVATYPSERDARSDYQAIRQAHAAGLVGSYDAAVITKDAAGRVHQNKDETATRHGAWWGIAAGAAIGLIFPPSLIGTAAVGGVIGGLSGHLAKGMSRSQARELGSQIEPGEAGLVVVGETRIEDAVSRALSAAEKQAATELDLDPREVDKILREMIGSI